MSAGSIPLFPRVSDYVAYHARQNPDVEALANERSSLSYWAFSDAVDTLARAMLAVGVAPGDRVATLQAPTPEYLIAFMATASIGAIWLGLNPKARRDELAYLVADAEPLLLLTRLKVGDRRYHEEIGFLALSCPSLQRIVAYDAGAGDPFEPIASLLAAGGDVRRRALDDRRALSGGRQPCLLVYTSGSTGQPKGALLHHEGIVRFCHEQNRQWPLDPHRSLNYLPINHIGCTVDLAVPCVIAGGTLLFMEGFNAARSLGAIEQQRLTLWASVPSVFALQIADPSFDQIDFSSVQLVLWEGAAMPADVFARIAAKAGPFATNYSMTETTGSITSVTPTEDEDILLQSVGLPFPEVDIRLLDQDRPVAAGEIGEVHVRSPFAFLGYWRRPAETAAAFTADGFFRTGDLARFRPDGRLQIVGRSKDMYKSGGYNVYPREVEDVIERHPGVALAAVVAVADPLWDEVGVAFAVPRDGTSLQADDVLAWCRERLSNYKVPKRFVILSEMPLLPIGKIDKTRLRGEAVRLYPSAISPLAQ